MHDFINLRFNARTVYVDNEEPSRFAHHWDGIVALLDEDETEIEIGAFKLIYVDVEGAMNEGESTFEVFDSVSNSLLGYYSSLYDGTDFNRSVCKAAFDGDALWRPNLLILDRLVIYPEHRGHSRGLRAMRSLIHHFRMGAGLIAIKPFPLQHEAGSHDSEGIVERQRLKLGELEQDCVKATKTLQKYYAKLGFKKVPRTPYMVLNPDGRLKDVG